MEWVLIIIGLGALFFVSRSWEVALFILSLFFLSAMIECVLRSDMLVAFCFFTVTGICWGVLGVITEEDADKSIRGKKSPVSSENHLLKGNVAAHSL